MISKQIVCGSGDLSKHFTEDNTKPILGPIARYIISLTCKNRPKFCFVGTASGDSPVWINKFHEACGNANVEPSDLQLFKSPNHENIREFLLSQDIIWVEGGSVDNLLAVWEVHGVYDIMREAYEKGIILSGYSAGSECWSAGGTTRDLGKIPRPFVNKNSILPFSSGVHNDIEPERQPLFHKLIEDDKIPAGYATEEGVSIHFINNELHKVISDTPSKAAYYVRKGEGSKIIETKLQPQFIK